MLDLGWRAIMVGVVFLVDAVVFVQLLREELRAGRSAPPPARLASSARLLADDSEAEPPRREAA